MRCRKSILLVFEELIEIHSELDFVCEEEIILRNKRKIQMSECSQIT